MWYIVHLYCWKSLSLLIVWSTSYRFHSASLLCVYVGEAFMLFFFLNKLNYKLWSFVGFIVVFCLCFVCCFAVIILWKSECIWSTEIFVQKPHGHHLKFQSHFCKSVSYMNSRISKFVRLLIDLALHHYCLFLCLTKSSYKIL